MAIPRLASSTFKGVVVSAGKMQKCVKVRVPDQTWNKRIQKYFATPYNILVSDPTDACREGDVVAVSSGWRVSKSVHHVVSQIVSPFGPPLSERPQVLSEEERLRIRTEKREAKDQRQAERGREAAVKRVKQAARAVEGKRRQESLQGELEKKGAVEKETKVNAEEAQAKEEAMA